MLRRVMRKGGTSLDKLGDLNKVRTGRCIEVLHEILQSPITPEALHTTTDIVKNLSQRKNFQFDSRVSTILDQIYLKGCDDQYKESYRSFLSETYPLQAARFHMRDLLQGNGLKEYRMAVDLFWQKVNDGDFESASTLQYFRLFQKACEHNDTEQIILLFNFMDKLGHFSPFNYSKVLLLSLKNQNPDVAELVYSRVSEERALTQHMIIEFALLFAKAESTSPLALELLGKIENKDAKKRISLEIAANLDPEHTWTLIDHLISDGVKIEYSELPPMLLSMTQLDRYSLIDTHIKIMTLTKNLQTKKLHLYSMLSSMDKTNVHFGAVAHILRLIELDYTILLESTHFDVILHVLSHSGAKISCIRALLLMSQLDIKPSLQNYYHAMRCQCFGKECNLLPLLAIQALNAHGILDNNITELITYVATSINDETLLHLLSPSRDIAKLKETFDYSYLLESFHYKDDRSADLHPTMKGFGAYNSDMDSHYFPLIGETIRFTTASL